MSYELVPVRMRDCACPDLPHADAGDYAYLKPEADLAVGLAAHTVLGEGHTDLLALKVALGKAYVAYGIARWDLLAESGQPLAVNSDTVNALPWRDLENVADKAAELYSEDTLRPLLAIASRRSQNGRINGSTSQSRRSSPSRPKR